MAITINGSGTITGVSVGGLPDGSVDADTLATDSVTAAKLKSDAIAAGDLPAGSILQVVSNQKTANFATTSTSFVYMGYSTAITPIASNSSILILVNPMLRIYNTDGANADLRWRLTDDDNSTYISSGRHVIHDYGGSGSILDANVHMTGYISNVGTTSTQTYKIYGSLEGGTQAEINPYTNDTSQFTVIEIAN